MDPTRGLVFSAEKTLENGFKRCNLLIDFNQLYDSVYFRKWLKSEQTDVVQESVLQNLEVPFQTVLPTSQKEIQLLNHWYTPTPVFIKSVSIINIVFAGLSFVYTNRNVGGYCNVK